MQWPGKFLHVIFSNVPLLSDYRLQSVKLLQQWAHELISAGERWGKMLLKSSLFCTCLQPINKSSRFSVGLRGTSRLGSAFIFLRWFKLAHICIKVNSLHQWKKQGINGKFLIGNRFHATPRIVSPIIFKQY